MSVGQTNPLRQQMINMMYLVLTALLAMNVSAEILKAFETVNEGMYKSIELIDLKNDMTMKQLEKLYQTTPGAVKPFIEKAVEANKISEELYKMIEVVKEKIIVEGKGINPETGQVADQANLEIPTRVLVEEGNGDKIAEEVMKARDKFKNVMKGVQGIDPEKFAESSITVNIEAPKNSKKSWATFTFHMVPNIAAITLLTKIQTDIRNTQANVLDALLNSIGKEDFKFDQLIPVINVVSGKSAVSVGEKYEAEILLAAYDSKQLPEIFLGGRPLDVKDGKAVYSGNTASQGSFDIPGEIVVKNKSTGEVKKYPYRLAYDVFNAPAIVSPTKMLVLYAALENPVSISVPGYRPQDITAQIEGGGKLIADKNPGDYLAVIPDPKTQLIREVNIKVFVKTPQGGTRQIGTGTKFRVKTVPKPIAYFGSKEGGDISVGEIKLVNFISVRLNDFAFEGLKYTVKKYKFIYVPKKGNAQFFEASSPALTQQMKQAIGAPGKGDILLITDIYASFPGSSDIRLPTALTLTVK
jgi:gliding motility-associated protein GldM